jgi:hypothetical protein
MEFLSYWLIVSLSEAQAEIFNMARISDKTNGFFPAADGWVRGWLWRVGMGLMVSCLGYAQDPLIPADPVDLPAPVEEQGKKTALGFGLPPEANPNGKIEQLPQAPEPPPAPSLANPGPNPGPNPPVLPDLVQFPPSLETLPLMETLNGTLLPAPAALGDGTLTDLPTVDEDEAPADNILLTKPWRSAPGAMAGGGQSPGILSASSRTFSGFTTAIPSPFGQEDSALDGWIPSPFGNDDSFLDRFGFSASLSGTYDSNPSLGVDSPDDSGHGDFSMTLGGSAGYSSRGSEWTYSLNYGGGYTEYFTQSELNGFKQSAGASVNYQGGPLSASLDIGVGFGSGANRYYQAVVDEVSLSYSLNAAYRYSPKTSFIGNFSQNLTNPDGGFGATGSFNLGASAIWHYSPLTQFGPGIRYSLLSGDTQQDRHSIGPTMTLNYRPTNKVTLNSQVGLDFSEYEDGQTTGPSVSSSVALNYRASRLWSMDLSLSRGFEASGFAPGQYEERTSLRLGYNRRIRNATWSVGASYENSGYESPDDVVGGAVGSGDYLSLDTSLGMRVFANTCAASLFLRYSGQNGGSSSRSGDSFQAGFSISRGF